MCIFLTRARVMMMLVDVAGGYDAAATLGVYQEHTA